MLKKDNKQPLYNNSDKKPCFSDKNVYLCKLKKESLNRT